ASFDALRFGILTVQMKTTLATPTPVRLMTIFAVVVVIACAAFAAASDRREEPAKPSSQEALFAQFSDLKEPLDGFDWDEEAGRLRRAAESVWQRNGWNEESDTFAREVACEVTAIPPWDVVARLNLLTTRITERYGLTEEVASRFRTSLLGEAGRLLMRHGPVMIEKGREVLAARVRGEPYSPRQVAEWAKLLEPVLADAQVSADRLAEEIQPSLDTEHKLLLGRDRESFQKRTKYVDAMRTRWLEGKWQPPDWGLEADPIQNRAVPPSVADPPAVLPIQATNTPSPSLLPSAAPLVVLPKCVPHDPRTWITYVLEFEQRLGLDAGQKSAAESIHGELVERAGDYSKTHRDELSPVPVADRATHAAYEPICAMFAELQARLDALPTTIQRVTQKP
ncbi:MAG: hypothetical protein AAB385_05270, partial [Planctomycetota bacterium]